MTIREEIIKLMEMYNENKYSTNIFCEVFSEKYYYENSGRDCFEESEQKILDELALVVERYSPYLEDIKKYPNTYYDERQVREVFLKIFAEFNAEKCYISRNYKKS